MRGKVKLKHTKLYEWGKKSKPGQQHYLILRVKKFTYAISSISDGGDRTCINTVVRFVIRVEWEPLTQQVMTQDLVSLVTR